MPQSKTILVLQDTDIQDIEPLVAEAFLELPYTIQYSPERVQEFLRSTTNKLMVGLCQDDGTILGVLLGCQTFVPTSFSPVAIELLWYVKPEYRKGKYALQMVREFEKWAKAQGCEMISMGNMANSSMATTGKFYERLGYKLSEQTYFKGLT